MHKIKNIKKIILVSSNKGGVGKSTIAANISAHLAKKKFNVGIIDADIYGSSIPNIFDITNINGALAYKNKTLNIKIASIGFVTQEPLIWRGPLITKFIDKLFLHIDWGNLDYLIIDTPPGTGDVHLNIMQNYQIDSMIVITTSHPLSIAKTTKMITMAKKFNIKIAGLIENMSYIIVNSAKQSLFGLSNTTNFCQKHKIPLITQIPIMLQITNIKKTTNEFTSFGNEIEKFL